MSKQRARDQNPLAFGQPSPTSLGVRGKDGSKDKHEWLKQYSSTADQQALGISSPIPPSHSLNSQIFFEFLLGFYKKSGILASQAFFLVLKGVCMGTLTRLRSRWKIAEIRQDWKPCSSLWSSETKLIYKMVNADVNEVSYAILLFWATTIVYCCVRS